MRDKVEDNGGEEGDEGHQEGFREGARRQFYAVLLNDDFDTPTGR